MDMKLQQINKQIEESIKNNIKNDIEIRLLKSQISDNNRDINYLRSVIEVLVSHLSVLEHKNRSMFQKMAIWKKGSTLKQELSNLDWKKSNKTTSFILNEN